MEKQKRQPRDVVVEFVAPYSLQECLYRLEVKAGKLLGTRLKVTVMEDASGCTFAVHAKKRSDFDFTRKGYLAPYDETSTCVTLYRAPLMANEYPSEKIVPVLLVAVIASLLTHEIVLFVFMAGCALLTWYDDSRRRTELLRLIQDTLGYTLPKKKRG